MLFFEAVYKISLIKVLVKKKKKMIGKVKWPLLNTIPIFADSISRISIPSFYSIQNEMYLISQDSLSPDCRVEKEKARKRVAQLQSIESWRRAVWKGSFERKDRSNSRKEPLFTSPQNRLPRNDLTPPSFPFVTSNDGVLACWWFRNNGMQLISRSNFPMVCRGIKTRISPLPSLADY